MDIHQLRNATALITLGEHRLLVDPMLGDPGFMPGLKFFGGGRRPNPLVPLPDQWQDILNGATGVLITHTHPDHLDSSARQWIRERGLPVWAAAIDVPHLRAMGLDARELRDGALGLRVEVIPARHGWGVIGWLMGPVSGFFLAHPHEPSLLMTADAVLTPELLETVSRLQPDLILAPAGSANFGKGADILFSVDELMRLAHQCESKVIFNHLEALDHCPTRRADLRARSAAEGLTDRVFVPDDGERLSFQGTSKPVPVSDRQSRPAILPGFQKWLTAKMG